MPSAVDTASRAARLATYETLVAMTVSVPVLGARPRELGVGRATRRSPLLLSRWILLSIFLVGYLVCDRVMGPLDRSFLGLTVLNVGALTLLLTRLDGALRDTLWAWSALFVFLTGVFLKMFWFVSKLNDPGYVNRVFPELRWVSDRTILSSYPWATLGFVTFCVAAWVALGWSTPPSRPRRPREVRELTGATLHTVVGFFLAYLVATLVQVRLGYGVLGVANPSVPGRVGTLLTLFRQYVVPGVLLLCLWVFDRRRRNYAHLTTGLIVLVALLNAAISTSRGVFPLTVASILLLWILTDRLTRQRRIVMITLALIAVVLFPVLSLNRYQKVAQAQGERATPSISTLTNAAFFMVTRPTGIEGVWQALDHRGRFSLPRVLHFMRPQVMTNYYTQSVVRVSRANDNRAPGVTGALMIMGGSGAVVVLMVLFVAFFQLAWRFLASLEAWPVLLALAGPVVAAFVSESPDPLLIVKLAVQIAICELLYRKVLRRPRPWTSTRQAQALMAGDTGMSHA